MRTKNGDCDNCILVNNKSYKDFILASDKNNVNNPDDFIVTDISKYGNKIYDFLKDKYPSLKFDILNHVICESNNNEAYDCHNHCFSNFVALSKKLNAKNCFIYGINYTISTPGFKNIDNIEVFSKCLEDLFNPKEPELFSGYTFKIPSKFYGPDYRLIDVQFIRKENRLIYIFRDKDNKKIFYDYPVSDNNYYWYKSTSSNKIIEKIDNLELVTGTFFNKNETKSCYGADVDIGTSHCVDYYLNSKVECSIVRQNIMFFDIETYQYHKKTFPDPEDAEYPIVAVSFRTDLDEDYTHVYLVAMKGEIQKDVYDKVKNYKHITLFNDERTMLRAWFKKIRELNIDYLCGWNILGFDIPYILKRISNVHIDSTELTPFGHCFADGIDKCSIPGMVALDQLILFKEFTHGVRPSYSLNNIAMEVLGKEKVRHVDKSIDDMYSDDIDLFLKYSTVDTDLIYEIEKQTGHVSLQNEIRRVATCSHSAARTTLGEADGIYQTAMKEIGCIGRNYVHDVEKEKVDGAYIFDARPGIYDGLLCDFDYKSLYPTTICTWNIGPDTYIGKIPKEMAYFYIFDRKKLKGKQIPFVMDPLNASKKMNISLEQLDAFMSKYHAQITIIGTIFIGHDLKESINCKVLNSLMNSRSVYKKKMLEEKEKGNKQLAREFNDKQLAYKILANALYGALGQEHFRFYNPILAESITATGQEMLKYSAIHLDYFMDGKFKDENGSDFVIDPLFADKIKNTKYVIYGDTDSVFVYLTDYLKKKKLPVEKCPDVLKEVSKLQDYVNKVAIPSLLKKHHINLDKSQMYLKNEFLMDRFYALDAKKKYASHIISQEGKTIDEVDVKGLEIKRSEVPPRSQKMLRDMLDVILDEKNSKIEIKKKLDNIVNESREDMKRLAMAGDSSIAKTVSYSKHLEEYKGNAIKQHIQGMMAWNALVGYDEFQFKSKGKLFNVMGIELDKAPKDIVENYYKNYMRLYPNIPIEAIVVPEGQNLPNYFKINLNKTIKYSCDDRAELMMSGLYQETDNDLLF